MPVISMFYGVVIRLFYKDNRQHHLPHIHAEYQEHAAVFAIEDGRLLEGTLPQNKSKLVIAWIEIHKDDLMADWKLAVEGSSVFKIKGLD